MFSPGNWDKNSSPLEHDRKPSPLKETPSMKEVYIVLKKKRQGKVKDKGPEGKVVSSKEQGVMNPVALQKDSEGMMRAMMKLMSGVKDLLQAVAGRMKEIRQDCRGSPAAWESDQAIHCEPKYKMLDLSMGSFKSPCQGLAEIRANHKEWYDMDKGKDGASGVFDHYMEVKGLVYHFSGAMWK
jgi:hypothetical protein